MAAGNQIPMNEGLRDVQTYQSDLAEFVSWARQMKGLRIFRQREKIKFKCVDNDPNTAANYAVVVQDFGIGGADDTAKLANAKRLFDEVASACGNIESSGIDEAAFQLEAYTQK